MHAVVTSLTFNERASAEAELSEIVARVSGMPGFVDGYWVALNADRGTSVIVFASEEAAQTFASFARGAPYGSVTPRAIHVGEVIGHTRHPSTGASKPGAKQHAGTDR